MPSFNITVDDVSPQWKYSSLWLTDNPRDGAYVKYGSKTFHATYTNGASATLAFNGTAITVYGAKRANHDQYQATLDGQAASGSSSPNGYGSPDEFQAPLFTAGSLDPRKEHSVLFADASSNPDRPWLDVDYAMITLGDGNSSTLSRDITLDDGASNITYSDGWGDGSSSGFANQYYNSTFHVTQKTGATANISFWGNTIQIFGAVSNNHGPFTVSLDGSPAVELSGAAWQFYSQVLLYHYSGLSAGPHNLVVTHTSQNSSEWFDLDKVIVSRWDGPFSSLPSGNSGNSTKKSKSISSGAIAGIVVGVLALLALLGLLLFFLRRRRQSASSDGARRRKSTRGPKPTDLMAESDAAEAVTMPVPRRDSFATPHSAPAMREGETLLSPNGYSTTGSSRHLPVSPAPADGGFMPPQYDEIVNYSQQQPTNQQHQPASSGFSQGSYQGGSQHGSENQYTSSSSAAQQAAAALNAKRSLANP